jgi:hypothetical protein
MKIKDRHSGIAGAQGSAKESSADRALPVLKGVEHHFVDLPGLRMHVAEAGSGRPLLLLHGFPQHWWEWRKVIPRLAEQFRVICPDLRGAGWTDAPRRGYTRDQLLADIVALLDTLGLPALPAHPRLRRARRLPALPASPRARPAPPRAQHPAAVL